MALISETPRAERERVLAHVLAAGDRLVEYALHPERLTDDERRRAGELGRTSTRQAHWTTTRLDIELNEVSALAADIDQLVDDIEQRLLRENDPIETGPEAAAGYWQERARQAEHILDEIDRRVNVHHSITEQTLDEVRSLLISYYDAKSRD